ncbi:helix-turn-helix domain-containing protein [Pedobacter gandavensis]|uniref:Helix-turn-helix domain-containing protein n=1 Tax=Pedobacter gandavensis TaxID=2679963 RepID=A0ABR6EQY8_9SPHI|nr:helix-turn-helix domain-containing protein [Pedobacter gandavensis]MBB2147660.1 helix-turn-helix domain-containing protein [Pedobacter gandavensis]
MQQKEAISKDLADLYKLMGLPLDSVQRKSGFTIHALTETFKDLPFKSIAYRPDYFSFVFLKDARGSYVIDEMSFVVNPGTIYFTNPGNYRSFEWTEIRDAYLITFNESFLKTNVQSNVFEDFSFLLTETVQPKQLPPEQFAEIELLYQLIYKEHLGDSPYKNKIIGNLFVALLLKIKEYFWQDYNPIQEGSRNSSIVKAFKQNLEAHYRALGSTKENVLLRVQDYADLQHLHANYLSTVIKTKTGKTVSTWIAEKTIGEAKSLLKNSKDSIKEISFLLGFAEPGHFSSYFKKHTQLTPIAYRKQNLAR